MLRILTRDTVVVVSVRMIDDSPHEEPLIGNASVGVVRVGDTVRRPVTTASASIDALLAHLHQVGFAAAPRALGYDDAGRQMLSYAVGHVDPDPSDLGVGRLEELGRLIRQLHDAASSFVAPRGAVWNVVIAPDREEIVCHNDLAPWNLVRTPTDFTIIDWDGAGPSSRLWDLAYAVHGFVPLSPRALLSDDDAAARLAALVRGYGLDVAERGRLVDLLAPRVRSMYELLRHGHDHGVMPWSRMWDEGHGDMWLADAHYVALREQRWRTALDCATDAAP